MTIKYPKLSKEERERRTFDELARLLGMKIVPGSIQQPNPRQPDILCEIEGSGHLAVELVSIDAPETRSRLDNMLATDEAWHRALTRRPSEEQTRLNAEAADVFVSISFGNTAGHRDRTTAMSAIQDFLLGNAGYKGALPIDQIGRPRGLGTTTIHRRRVTHGPKFSHFSAGSWLPPQVSKITEKLRDKTYASSAPIELFAYSTHDEPDGAVGSLEAIQAAVMLDLADSQFRGVHLFNLGFGRHIWSSPVSVPALAI